MEEVKSSVRKKIGLNWFIWSPKETTRSKGGAKDHTCPYCSVATLKIIAEVRSKRGAKGHACPCCSAVVLKAVAIVWDSIATLSSL